MYAGRLDVGPLACVAGEAPAGARRHVVAIKELLGCDTENLPQSAPAIIERERLSWCLAPFRVISRSVHHNDRAPAASASIYCCLLPPARRTRRKIAAGTVQPQTLNGCYRRPTTPPRACAFFLGGAFVGAAPQLAYGALCQRLADSGYVVLAAPFKLQFDYLELCDTVLSTAEPAHAALVEEYGELPLVGVGHSCGALLHVLLSSAFRGTGVLADIERVANVHISFNNKPSQSAILFGELVAPATSLYCGSRTTHCCCGGRRSPSRRNGSTISFRAHLPAVARPRLPSRRRARCCRCSSRLSRY